MEFQQVVEQRRAVRQYRSAVPERAVIDLYRDGAVDRDEFMDWWRAA